jgi:hypothetical protein
MVPQDAIATPPVAPNGQVIPWSSGTSIKDSHGRNLITNPAVFRDGFKRKPARGNHTSKSGFKTVPSLAWLGWPLTYLSGALVSSRGVKDVAITNGGSGYVAPFTVTFTGGGGTGAQGTAIVNAGAVTGVTMTNYGSGYTTAPTPVFTAGAGTLAAGTSSLWYLHTGQLSLTALFFMLEAGWSTANLFYRFMDQTMSAFKLDCPVEGIFECSFDTVGTGTLVKETTSIDATPTELAGDPGEYANLSVLRNGADSGVINKLGLDISIKTPEKRTHNKGGKASEIKRGGIEVKVTADTYFEGDALWADARDGVESSIEALLVQGAEEFEFKLSEVDLAPTGPEIENEDGTMQNFSGESFYGNDAKSPFWFQLRNQVPSYPTS